MNVQLNVMNMEYQERLNVEMEFEDLKADSSKNYIELCIKDQSVYWGDNLLLTEKELNHMNQVAKQLNDYMGLVAKKKRKLCEQEVQNICRGAYINNTIASNTKNNSATGNANLASQRIENRKKHDSNNNDNDNDNSKRNNKNKKKQTLMIYTQSREVKANPKILDQLTVFQKSMKELARHYWNCFPANHQRLQKAKIIVSHLQEYKHKLVAFQKELQRRNKTEQKILCQELIDLADKVLQHNTNTEKELKQKKERLKQITLKNNENDENNDNNDNNDNNEENKKMESDENTK